MQNEFKRLDLVKVAEKTLEVMCNSSIPYTNQGGDVALTINHCKIVLLNIKDNAIPIDQADRMIGWVQAVLSMHRIMSMEEFKDLNRSCPAAPFNELEVKVNAMIEMLNVTNLDPYPLKEELQTAAVVMHDLRCRVIELEEALAKKNL